MKYNNELYIKFNETLYISIHDLYGNNPTEQDRKDFIEFLDKHKRFKNKFEKTYYKWVIKYLQENCGLVSNRTDRGMLSFK